MHNHDTVEFLSIVSKDFFLGLFRLETVFRSLNFNNVLLALALFENYNLNVGAIQITQVMERRGQNMGPMGFAQKKEENNKGCVTLWPCHLH
jgi:hypothetical protein